MKNKHIKTPLVDEYLQSLESMQPAEAEPFLYTRLKAKMEKQAVQSTAATRGWVFAICTIAVFLVVNFMILLHPLQKTIGTQQPTANAQQNFVNTYSVGGAPSY
jgi:hypothetical protein